MIRRDFFKWSLAGLVPAVPVTVVAAQPPWHPLIGKPLSHKTSRVECWDVTPFGQNGQKYIWFPIECNLDVECEKATLRFCAYNATKDLERRINAMPTADLVSGLDFSACFGDDVSREVLEKKTTIVLEERVRLAWEYPWNGKPTCPKYRDRPGVSRYRLSCVVFRG